MRLDRGDTDHEVGCDVIVGHALGQKVQDVRFSLGEKPRGAPSRDRLQVSPIDELTQDVALMR